jgi:energy-coupling factor transport system permease protein
MSLPLALGPARPVPLSAVNPVAQLTAIAVLTVVLLVSGDLVTPAVVLAAELALLPAAGLTTPRDVLRRTWPLLLSAAGVAWVNVAFGSLSGSEAWLAGATWGLRVIALALPGVLLVAATDPVRLADALTVHWRVPERFAYGALAALRLVPLLAAEWDTIRLARRARGVDAGSNPVAGARLFAGTAFALLVGAIRRGTRLATAMDARGFDSGMPRTRARASVLHPRDRWFVAGTATVCAAAVAVSVLSGAWDPLLVG